MASQLLRKIIALLRGPQAARLTERARQTANRPENRRRIAELMRRLSGTRRS
jgi:hypothetical protein